MRLSYPMNIVLLGLLLCPVLAFPTVPAGAAELSVVSIEQLRQILVNPELVIIDVRHRQDWQSSDVKIKGAVRHAPENFDAWAHALPKDKQLVLY